ncbi:MAG: hypothetical protein GEV06_28295 [Luteitalea sp.]|nr:hypothetical protein [Luteitalea sp.]
MSDEAFDRWAQRALRIALGAAFLSAVAGRFGLWSWTPWTVAFDRFLDRTAALNAFMPAWTIPFLAWGATIAEITLGVALIAGLLRYWTALGAAILLAVFGTEMAVFDGIKSPLDYSVFSASAGALLLASRARGRTPSPTHR